MAAPSTEDLIIQMRVDMGRLEADLRAANARLDQMGNAGRGAGDDVDSGMKKARKAANDFGAAVVAAGAAATAALAGVIASTLQTVDVINRVAGATGMAAEEFQYYAAGARMLGVEQEELGAVFRDTQEKIGEFLDTGGGGMIDFFEQVAPLVGVTAEELNRLGGAKALQLVYDSMEKVGLSSDQMIFQLEAIASESSTLIPLLRNGGEGFKFFGDQAQQAGAILDRDLIRSTTELKVQMNELSANFTGARNEIARQLIPTLLDLGDAFSDNAEGGEVMVSVAAAIATAVKIAGATALGAISAFELFGKSLAAFGTTFQGVSLDKGLIHNMITIVGNVKQEGSAFDAALEDLSKTAEARATQLQKAWDAGLGETNFSLGTDILTAQTRRSASGATSTQAERDKQAAADKANAARLEAERKAAQTQLDNQKAAAEALRKSLLEQLMTERQLITAAHQDKETESLRLTKGLEGGAQQHAANMILIEESYRKALADLDERELQAEIEAAAAAGTAGAEAHEQEMAARIARAEQLREIDAQQRLATAEGKLAAIEENHLLEQELIAELFEEGFISEQERQARLLQLDKDTKDARLNATRELFDGQRKLQTMMQDFSIKSAASFFAQDLGGFSAYSRKAFELQKAAKIAEAAVTIPKTVMDAYAAGTKFGGPVGGAAFAATALAAQMGNLRRIQSATYGGGSGGGSSGGGGGGSGGDVSSSQEQQPRIERFVNLSIVGESNDITSIGSVRNLIERINGEIQNGAVLRVN
jgi:hypothetical protein